MAHTAAHTKSMQKKNMLFLLYIYGAYRGAHQKIRFRCRFGVSEVSAHTTQVASTMAGQSLGLGLGRASTGSRRWPASRLDWASGGPVWPVRSGQIPGQTHMSR